MNKLDSKTLSVEMVNFSFSSNNSECVALTSCVLAVPGYFLAPCLGAALSLRVLNRADSFDLALLRWYQSKSDESTSWARLTHRHVFINDNESFEAHYDFMGLFERAALQQGVQMWPAQVYWAHFEACLANWDFWPQPEARACMERATFESQNEPDCIGLGVQDLSSTRRL